MNSKPNTIRFLSNFKITIPKPLHCSFAEPLHCSVITLQPPFVQLHRKRERNWWKQRLFQAFKPPKEPTSICDLPEGVIDTLVHYFYKDESFQLRATCQFMYKACDKYLMDQFNRNYAAQIKEDSESKDATIYRVLFEATTLIIRYDISSGFFCSIMRVFDDPSRYYVPYLRQYYHTMDSILGGCDDPRRKFSFSANFMSLLAKFLYKDVQLSESDQGDTLIRVEIPGMWFAVDYAKGTTNFMISDIELTVILAELIFGCFSETSIKRIHQAKECVYIYGYEAFDPSELDIVPQTVFHIRLRATHAIREILLDCLYVDRENLVWPVSMRLSPFQLDIRVECEEASKWNCYELYDVTPWLDQSPFDVDNEDANEGMEIVIQVVDSEMRIEYNDQAVDEENAAMADDDGSGRGENEPYENGTGDARSDEDLTGDDKTDANSVENDQDEAEEFYP